MNALLLRYRLHWYTIATARLLLRRWQAVLLVISLLQPLGGPGPLADIAVLPFSVLLASEHGFWWRFIYIVMLQILWAVWAMMQREQIGGGAFMHYAQSLPLPLAVHRRTNLIVLLLADSPLLLMVTATGIFFGMREADSAVLSADYLYLLAMTLLFLTAQLGALDRSYALWVILPADLLLAGALGSSAVQLKIVLLVALCFIGTAAVSGRIPVMPVKRYTALWYALGDRLSQVLLARLHPALQISVCMLFRQRYSEMLSKSISSALIIAAAIGLMDVWHYDGRALPFTHIALAGIALSVSGLYRGMHMSPIWRQRHSPQRCLCGFGGGAGLMSLPCCHSGCALPLH
ncbi:MAG: hypothetical protein ABL919_00055 [Methylococcales bacterium]|nr:hypothetical protein [Methylococcaceae bacterium]